MSLIVLLCFGAGSLIGAIVTRIITGCEIARAYLAGYGNGEVAGRRSAQRERIIERIEEHALTGARWKVSDASVEDGSTSSVSGPATSAALPVMVRR